jgi:phytanoyl-CoA hydroxylase
VLGELWIDKEGALEKGMATIPHDLQDNFKEFMEKGYTIFKGVVDEDTVDQIVKDTHQIYSEPNNYILKNQGKYLDPNSLEALGMADRVVDLYGVSEAARKTIFSSPALRFLGFIFGEAPIATQSISFEYGSQQALHQDTAYVISNNPLSLAATWLALEDITPGSGELSYYPGSHRFDHFLFSGKYKSWNPARDSQEQHQQFLKNIHTTAGEKGIEQEFFVAKKGDVLVWHADLAHGGSKITVPSVTRQSLVTHFVPFSVKATYKQHIEDIYYELPTHEGAAFFTSRHYDLRDVPKGGYGKIIYDGGVTKRRIAAQKAAQ